MIFLLSILKPSYLIPAAFFAAATILASIFYALKAKKQTISFKVFMIYSVITILLYALCGLIGFIEFEKPFYHFIISQILFFIFGFIHFYYLSKLISGGDESNFFHELIFTIYIAILGVFAYQIVVSFTPIVPYFPFFTLAQLIFIIPFLLLKTAQQAISIPEKVYTKWYFPVNENDFEIPDEMLEDRNVIIIEIRVQRSLENLDIIPIRAKAPLKMDLGLLFVTYINEFNDSNPGKQIKILDDTNSSFGWNFYFKPGFFGSVEYIDPSLSIREAGVRENDVIIAERV